MVNNHIRGSFIMYHAIVFEHKTKKYIYGILNLFTYKFITSLFHTNLYNTRCCPNPLYCTYFIYFFNNIRLFYKTSILEGN